MTVGASASSTRSSTHAWPPCGTWSCAAAQIGPLPTPEPPAAVPSAVAGRAGAIPA